MKRLAAYIKKTTNIEAIKKSLNTIHDYDIAQLLLLLDSENRKKLYTIYDDEELAQIIAHLEEKDASYLLDEVGLTKKAAIMSEMEPDDALDLLQESSEIEQSKILELLDTDLRLELIELNEHSEYTAGAIMTPHFIKVLSHVDIKIAMKTLVSDAPQVESINTIFVTDETDKLLGVIPLKKLFIAKTPCDVNDLMNSNFKYVNSDTDIEEVTKLIKDYGIYDLPVLEEGVLKGIITMDDAIDNLLDEASEDYARLAGLTTDQQKDESFMTTIRKRIPWLVALLILDLFTPLIGIGFQFLFEKPGLILIMFFQASILGLAGNSSMQSLAITIRGISNKSLDQKKAVRKHLGKEITLGLLFGVTLGIVSFIASYIMLSLRKEPIELEIYKVSLTVSIAILIALVVSNLVGSLMPLMFYRFKIDPAVASGPFITTVIDVFSVVLYFVLALILLYYGIG